jgi:hypothetical protein
MKHATLKLTVLAGLILALLSPIGLSAKGYHQSGITGQVTGFTEPYQFIVVVLTADGKTVTRFVTEPGGAFSVGLKPGNYVLIPFLRTGGPGSPTLKGLPTPMRVEKKSFTDAILPFFLPH